MTSVGVARRAPYSENWLAPTGLLFYIKPKATFAIRFFAATSNWSEEGKKRHAYTKWAHIQNVISPYNF